MTDKKTKKIEDTGRWLRVASGTRTLYRCSRCRKNSFGGPICPNCKAKVYF